MFYACLKKDILAHARKERAKVNAWFFKTGKGEYGEGDAFWGLPMGQQRSLAQKYKEAPFEEIKRLLNSNYHEERMIGLLILVFRFEKGDVRRKKQVFDFYIKHRRAINNWDLVDVTCPNIVGEWLINKPRALLYRFARSKNLWEKRIAILATYRFIRRDDFNDTFAIAELLLNDEHDLIHKAVGWMLREVGKRSVATEEAFLKKHYKHMPRTMLRYAIEKIPEARRRAYLKGTV